MTPPCASWKISSLSNSRISRIISKSLSLYGESFSCLWIKSGRAPLRRWNTSIEVFYPLSRSDKEVEGAGNSVPCRGIGAMRPLCGNQHGGNWKLQGARMAFVKRARLPQAEDSAPMHVSRIGAKPQERYTMQNEAVALLRCPICSGSFRQEGKSLFCERGHCYDIARQGHVNFAPNAKQSFYKRSCLRAARRSLKRACSHRSLRPSAKRWKNT
ncbi:MAG: putative RNA methyltransferase [Christensenellales bacterium]